MDSEASQARARLTLDPEPGTRRVRCRICGCEADHSLFRVPEMMFGLAEDHLYFECSSCGCLQILDFPSDSGRYYPPTYWPRLESRGLRRALRRRRDEQAFFGGGWWGRFLLRIFPYPHPAVRAGLSGHPRGRDCRILDVGCGTGTLVGQLAEAGFRDVTGVDPFLPRDAERAENPRLLATTIHELDGTFDLIMFHHSLEHIPDQRETLASVADRLAEDGRCLIRVPIASSYAWEHYREQWVQLDAPRHLFLHTVESLTTLARSAGLRLTGVEYDSDEFQFLGSELYRMGIPLVDGRSRFQEIFGRSEIRRFREMARELNASGRGDQAAFTVVKA